MEVKQTQDGKFILASFKSTTGRFRSLLTKDFGPSEGPSVDDIPNVRKYVSRQSIGRAIRKYRDKL